MKIAKIYFLLFIVFYGYTQISYQLLNNYSVLYSNSVGVSCDYSNSFTNLVYVTENVPYTYLINKISTNSIFYANEEIAFGIMAVDSGGRHVTIPVDKNIDLKAKHSNNLDAPGNLRYSSFKYKSKEIDVPDFIGVIMTNSYDRAGYIKIAAEEEKKITNVEIKSYNNITKQFTLQTNIFTNTSAFYSPFNLLFTNTQPFAIWQYVLNFSNFILKNQTVSLNMSLIAETNYGKYLTNDVTSNFICNNLMSNRISMVDFHNVKGILEGLGKIRLIETNFNIFSTNVFLYVMIEKDKSYNLDSGNFVDNSIHKIEIENNTFNNNIYFDARHPSNWAKEYTVSDNTKNLGKAIENFNSKRIKIIQRSILQMKPLMPDMNEHSSPLNKYLKLVFSYNDEDLYEEGERILAETEIKPYKLENDKWIECDNYQLDIENNKLNLYINDISIYSIGSTHTRIITTIDRVEAYPNPLIMQQNSKLQFINLPQNFNYLKIFTIGGRLVKKFVIGNSVQLNNIEEKALYHLDWNCKDETENDLAGGLYYFEVKQGNTYKYDKFVIVR